jgi:hypothetical protein
VIRLIGRVVTIVALCLAVGLHWLVLQSLAWTTMAIKYSRQQSLTVAISQTFDGAHPCSLCHAVSKGKNTEKKSEFRSGTPKIDIICSVRTVSLLPPFVPFSYSSSSSLFSAAAQAPLVPPPRSVLG